MRLNNLEFAQPGFRRRMILLPVFSGILGFLSFPSADFWCLAWIAYAGLVLYIRNCRSVAAAAAGGFAAGALQYAGLLAWVPSVMRNYGGVPGAGAYLLYGLLVALQSSFPALVAGLTRLCLNRWGDRGILIFPVFWVAAELAQTAIPFGGFPWLLTGYSQTSFTHILQCADLSGVLGISFLVIWTNTALAWAWIYRKTLPGQWGPMASAALLIAGGMAYGNHSVARWDRAPAKLKVAMLQQNISVHDPSHVMDYKFRDGYLRMAERLGPDTADLLVLPESPSPLSYQYDEKYRQTMRSLAKRFRLGLIFNNIAFEEIAGRFHYFNSAYMLGRDGGEMGRYDKVHLVPFGEYIPLKSLFFFVESISKDVSDFYPGRTLQPIFAEGRPLGAIICFEAVFPQISRSLVRQGAQVLINLSNDAWYGDSAAPFQHLAMARWRAVENRRFLLRATNSGITAVITPSGRIAASTGLFREEICSAPFDFQTEASPYSRSGDVLGMLCAIITVLVIIAGLVEKLANFPSKVDMNQAAGGDRRQR